MFILTTPRILSCCPHGVPSRYSNLRPALQQTVALLYEPCRTPQWSCHHLGDARHEYDSGRRITIFELPDVLGFKAVIRLAWLNWTQKDLTSCDPDLVTWLDGRRGGGLGPGTRTGSTGASQITSSPHQTGSSFKQHPLCWDARFLQFWYILKIFCFVLFT